MPTHACSMWVMLASSAFLKTDQLLQLPSSIEWSNFLANSYLIHLRNQILLKHLRGRRVFAGNKQKCQSWCSGRRRTLDYTLGKKTDDTHLLFDSMAKKRERENPKGSVCFLTMSWCLEFYIFTFQVCLLSSTLLISGASLWPLPTFLLD